MAKKRAIDSFEAQLQADLEAVRTFKEIAARRGWVVRIEEAPKARLNGRSASMPIDMNTDISERESAIIRYFIKPGVPEVQSTSQIRAGIEQSGQRLPPGRPEAAVRVACERLEEENILEQVVRGKGRRPTTYTLTSCIRKDMQDMMEKEKRKESEAAAPPADQTPIA